MKDISQITCCVVDTGLFMQLARVMGEACGRVLYYNPETRAFPSIKQGCLADGFDNVEVVREFWPKLDEIDLFCFPDSRMAGLQVHLEKIGKAVWGSRYGQDYEQKRKLFMRMVEEFGLDVAPYEEVMGMDRLRDHLQDKEDKYIKVSHWRGDMETFHWRSFRLDEGWLDWMEVNLGPMKNHMEFLVFDAIETDLEIGADTYCIDGKWPGIMLNGIEGKDKSYLAAVTPTSDMPKQILEVLDAFSDNLKLCRYRNQWSMEVRVAEDKAYFIDATCRGGMPSTASQHLLWKNFPEIVWAGANGELLEPEPAAMFSIETMITSKGGGHDTWDVVEIEPGLEKWCRFSNCCYVDGCYAFPPDELKGQDLGWLIAIGDTPEEVLQEIKDHADALPDGLNADVESLADVIKEIETAQKQGIPFTDENVPDPEEVIT